MPTEYQQFVSQQLKKAPGHLKQTEKMKWCGDIWRKRKDAKGIDSAPPKPPKKKAAKGEGLVAPGAKTVTKNGRGTKAKGDAAKPRTKKDIFKDTGKVVSVASKAGLLDKVVKKISPEDLAATRVLNGGVHMNRGRKGANLVSIKTHT